MARKSGLGRGMNAIIPETTLEEGAKDTTRYVPVDIIIPNPRQPRQKINDDTLEELAASIREHGIIQPLLVTHDRDNNTYVLIAGERRLRAAKKAGLEAVPVLEREATDQQRLELALIENVQRADLTPLETAEAYRQLYEEFKLTQGEIAQRVGKSRETISNTLRLFKLTETVLQALAMEKITEGHARALLGLKKDTQQIPALNTILDQKLNVRETEKLVRQLNDDKPHKTPKKPQPEILDFEEKLRDRLGTKVTIRHGKRGGNIVIHYYNDEDLNTVIKQITGDQI